MYFLNEQHQQNYNHLVTVYPIGQQNKQFTAGFYVVAVPEIFNHCDKNPMCEDNGPYDWYFNELDRYGEIVGLSFENLQLAKAGLLLYNNHSHDDSYDDFSLYVALGYWADDLFKVYVQACEIKLGRQVFNI